MIVKEGRRWRRPFYFPPVPTICLSPSPPMVCDIVRSMFTTRVRKFHLFTAKALLAFLLAASAAAAAAQVVDTIDPAMKSSIDAIAAGVMEQRGVPSASVAVGAKVESSYTPMLTAARTSIPTRLRRPRCATPLARSPNSSPPRPFYFFKKRASSTSTIQSRKYRSRPDARRRGHDPPDPQPHQRLSGLLARRLPDEAHAGAHHRAGDPRPLGEKAARLRSWHSMAVLQHELT